MHGHGSKAKSIMFGPKAEQSSKHHWSGPESGCREELGPEPSETL